MISLDGALWSELSHAYGPADDIPALLRDLEGDPRPKSGFQDEPWYSLWSALCHQGDVYTASYAASPLLIAIASSAQPPVDGSFFSLPAQIEIARHLGRGPTIPSALKGAYRAGLAQVPSVVARHLERGYDKDLLSSMTTALAAAAGHHALAEAISNLDDYYVEGINAQREFA